MDPQRYAFRSLMALIGALGGGACFGFFALVQPESAGLTFELPAALRPAPAIDSRPVVIVDAGHGGLDGGASGSGFLEKNLTLGMARQLGAELERLGIRAIQTREEDVTLSLEERSRLANRHPGAVFVSVHFNTSSAPQVRGLETYYTSPKSLTALAGIKRQFGIKAASRLHDERNRFLAEKVQEAVTREVDCPDRGVRNKSLLVTREVTVPAILVECAYLTNEKEVERLRSRSYRAALARGIAKGVRKYLDAAKASGEKRYGLVVEGAQRSKVTASAEGGR